MMSLHQTLRIKFLIAAVLLPWAIIADATPAVRAQFRRGLATRPTAAAPTVLAEQTPYPAAGFRPRVPFELPHENRQPKALPEPTTAPTIRRTPPSAVEDFSFKVTTENPIENKISGVEEQDGLDLNVQIGQQDLNKPVNTYGAPRPDINDDTVEIIVAPVNRFEPPNKEAVEDFGGSHELADGIKVTAASSTGVLNENDAAVFAEAPEHVYGAPLFTADGRQVPEPTYGAPDITANELLPFASGNLAQQSLQMLHRMHQLHSGRLVVVPADGSQLRRVYFATLPARQQQQMLQTKPEKLVAANV